MEYLICLLQARIISCRSQDTHDFTNLSKYCLVFPRVWPIGRWFSSICKQILKEDTRKKVFHKIFKVFSIFILCSLSFGFRTWNGYPEKTFARKQSPISPTSPGQVKGRTETKIIYIFLYFHIKKSLHLCRPYPRVPVFSILHFPLVFIFQVDVLTRVASKVQDNYFNLKWYYLGEFLYFFPLSALSFENSLPW